MKTGTAENGLCGRPLTTRTQAMDIPISLAVHSQATSSIANRPAFRDSENQYHGQPSVAGLGTPSPIINSPRLLLGFADFRGLFERFGMKKIETQSVGIPSYAPDFPSNSG